MTTTAFGSLSTLQKKVWLTDTIKQGRDASFWFSNGFVSKDSSDMNKPIQRITELTETERGTEAVMNLVLDITGGVVGDNDLEGNEQPMNADTQSIKIDQLRNAVKSQGKMAEQATVLRFRVQAKDQLGFWLGDTQDELAFLTLSGRAYSLNTDGSSRGTSQFPQLRFASDVTAASTNRIVYAGSATSEGTLTASDTMNWDLVIKAKSFAKRKKIRPIKAGGRDYYILVLTTEQARDLEQDPDYKTLNAQAMPRGIDNPLFTNAKRVVSDVVIYDHQKTYNTLGLTSGNRWGSGGTVHGAQALLLGACAMGFAQLGGGQEWTENSLKDYGNKPGIGIGRIFGLLKPQFKSKADANAREDYGVVAVKTAAAA